MARYIDADAIIEQMLNHYKALRSEYGDYDHYTTGYDDAIDTIQCFPTADVAPKSEVDRLTRILNSYALQYGTVRDQQKVIDQAKTEVAREFFSIIEEHNYTIFDLYNVVDIDWFDELKKKYTGVEK